MFSVFLLLLVPSLTSAASKPMKLVGSLLPWQGQFGAVVVDANRGVAYMGSLDANHGPAVIDIRNREHPVLSMDLGPAPQPDSGQLALSFDVDLVGRYLIVSHHQELGRNAFSGLSVYDTAADPFHPTLLRRIPHLGDCGLESAILDPEVENGRPYAYCFSHCIFNGGMYTVNILTGEVLSRFVSLEPLPCPPFPCHEENLPHEGTVQRHPTSHRMLVYIGYWDSGLRIADVTNPTSPVEVGSFDYGAGTPNRNAHGAVPTPSGNWVYVGDEFGDAEPPGGGIHIFDAHTCDGTSYCTAAQVGFYHTAGNAVQSFEEVYSYFFAWDVHNMTAKGENTLLFGNYGYGARLIDTSNKANPSELSFYVPNTPAPMEWVALFGSDDLVYASDINSGLLILKPKGLDQEGENAAVATLRITSRTSGPGAHEITFTTQRDGRIALEIFDVVGRRVAIVEDQHAAAGSHTLAWNGLRNGRPAATGLYFARASTPDGKMSGKLLHLAP